MFGVVDFELVRSRIVLELDIRVLRGFRRDTIWFVIVFLVFFEKF